MENKRILRTTAFTLLAVAGVAALGVLLVRDQISRSKRDLFSPTPCGAWPRSSTWGA